MKLFDLWWLLIRLVRFSHWCPCFWCQYTHEECDIYFFLSYSRYILPYLDGIFFLFFWCYFRYTLRNAEYRLCLERNLDFDDGNKDKQSNDNCRVNLHEMLLDSANLANVSDENESYSNFEESLDKSSESINIQGIGETSPEVQQHILHLQFQLSSIKKVFILVSLVTLSLLI